jgi:glycosyltransferase involved in cell wall biosynthesis
MKTVSVIMPVHNGERYVEQALRSIATQTEGIVEIVVIDDASTDGTMHVVDAFAKEGSLPVRILQTRGVGQSAARNEGAQIASGDFLAFLDQDDVWLEGHLAGLMECLENDPSSAMAYSDVNTIDSHGGLLSMRINGLAANIHPKRSVLEIIGADVMALPSATLVRRKSFLDLGGFDPELQGYEDDDLYFRGFRAGWNPTYVDKARVNYRIHGSGSSLSPTFRSSRLKYTEKIAIAFPDDPLIRSHHIRDLLVPRMRKNFILDYLVALNMGELAVARSIARDLQTLLGTPAIRPNGRLSRKARVGLWLLTQTRLARLVLNTRSWWFPRWLIPAELRLRP